MAPFLDKFFQSVYRKEELDHSTNQYCKFNSQMLTMFTSSLYLAALFASFFASMKTKKRGCKFSMLMGDCVFCCGALLNVFAVHLAMLIIGRILLGVGVGFATQGNLGWHISFVPAVLMILSSLWVSETPNSLIERGHFDRAKKQLQHIRGVAHVQAEFNDLVDAGAASKKVEHPWRNLLMSNYRPQLCLALLIPMFQQLTGINVVMFYAPVLFKTVGF
ncbi:Sugar transport protein 1 [Camellia lanceoleosa]|uniref:Sugar transport protein 1 n=1 Tax=Camellia lanceoleosa TaxID=1840588 RepID=A0ACC0IGY1_9ERIC|nr:Sugar transport protein 1 [Camellia lanceoleosa]